MKENLEGKKFNKLTVIKYLYSKNYKNYYGCICECGNITKTDEYGLTRGRTKSCGCLKTSAAKKATAPINLEGTKIGRLNILQKVVLDKTYNGKPRKASYYYAWCDCEKDLPMEKRNVRLYSQALLRKGNTKSCGCLRKETSYKTMFKDISNQKFNYLTAIKPITKNHNGGNITWLCKCDCGNMIETKGGRLISGNTKSCGKCNLIRTSFGEEKVRNILKENNIEFEEQYKYDDLFFKDDRYKLKFDFYVNNEYLIEYDGEQHYRMSEHWGGEESLKYLQQCDNIKNEYCRKNGIPLIRIPYWHYNDLKLEDLLLETSEFLVI